MKEFKGVVSTSNKIIPLEFNIDTIYMRTNIKKFESEYINGWKYDEVQYSLMEYQKIVLDDVISIGDVVVFNTEDVNAIAESISKLTVRVLELESKINELTKGDVKL